MKSYSWTTTVETPGAPFTIPATQGKVDKAGFSVHESKFGDTTLLAVTKGDRVVLKAGTEWKTLPEMSQGKVRPSADLADLADAKAPADELVALSAKLTETKLEADASYSGKLAASDAKDIMSQLVKRRAPMPDVKVSSASGTLRIELKEGVPRRYIVETTGAISLPFGTKEIKRVATVNISDLGAPTLVVPAGAKAKLEAITKP
jgi:hypothetical protein